MSECIDHGQKGCPHGYGSVRHDGKAVKAHRVAYIKCHGPIPDGVWVRHKCDNPRCINVQHLELGTQSQNELDKRRVFKYKNPPYVNKKSGGYELCKRYDGVDKRMFVRTLRQAKVLSVCLQLGWRM